MNREDIIRMAREAGFERLGHTEHDFVCYPEDLERFAALVASAEREACEEICVANEALGLATAIRARGQE